MNIIRRCEHCCSLFVCWNWFIGNKQWIKDHNKPHYDNTPLELIPNYGHECWDCGNVQETYKRVRNGIPYWVLKTFYKYFKTKIKMKYKKEEV